MRDAQGNTIRPGSVYITEGGGLYQVVEHKISSSLAIVRAGRLCEGFVFEPDTAAHPRTILSGDSWQGTFYLGLRPVRLS